MKGVYISVDVDCLDPAFAPGVSHIEPGGLSFRDVLNILHNLQGDVVAGDVVEFNPQRDTVDGMTAMVAAKLVRELTAKISKWASIQIQGISYHQPTPWVWSSKEDDSQTPLAVSLGSYVVDISYARFCMWIYSLGCNNVCLHFALVMLWLSLIIVC